MSGSLAGLVHAARRLTPRGAGQAPASFLVSFVYVQSRPARTTKDRLPRSTPAYY